MRSLYHMRLALFVVVGEYRALELIRKEAIIRPEYRGLSGTELVQAIHARRYLPNLALRAYECRGVLLKALLERDQSAA